MNKCIIFKYKGKFAHFLKAEANASAPSYPFPTRTILLGLAGAVLGLQKDSPQIELKDANFAVAGLAETTHWHTAKMNQTYNAPLSFKIKRNSKGSKGGNKTLPKRVAQEWLIKPNFTIYAQMPEKYHDVFERRLKNKEWYFSPSLGLSEMMADLEYIKTVELKLLNDDVHKINTTIRKSQVVLDMETAFNEGAIVKSIRMPRDVSEKREFAHETYFYEVNGNHLTAKTTKAYQVENKIISWL